MARLAKQRRVSQRRGAKQSAGIVDCTPIDAADPGLKTVYQGEGETALDNWVPGVPREQALPAQHVPQLTVLSGGVVRLDAFLVGLAARRLPRGLFVFFLLPRLRRTEARPSRHDASSSDVPLPHSRGSSAGTRVQIRAVQHGLQDITMGNLRNGARAPVQFLVSAGGYGSIVSAARRDASRLPLPAGMNAVETPLSAGGCRSHVGQPSHLFDGVPPGPGPRGAARLPHVVVVDDQVRHALRRQQLLLYLRQEGYGFHGSSTET